MAREAVRRSIGVPAAPVRGRVELDRLSLQLTLADGRWRSVVLTGAWVRVRDASFAARFVRHAAIEASCGDRAHLITPPEEGAIAPKAARLPGVPGESVIIDGEIWETVVGWIRSGGGLNGRTITDLAQLACLATSPFAVVLGECAAHVAVEMTWDRLGPMRGGGDLVQMLRPLRSASQRSARAAEALTAAMALGAILDARTARRRR